MPSPIFDKASVLATIGEVGKFFRDAPGWRKNVSMGKWSVDAKGVVLIRSICPVIWYSS
jgi:hypothetical protein